MRACLLIHGWLTDIADFGILENYLGSYDKVVFCKLPGHNDKVDYKLFTPDAAREKVFDDFDKLAQYFDEIDCVGYSLGGALCSYLACCRSVRRLVLAAPANDFLNFATIHANASYFFRRLNELYRSQEGDESQKWKNVFEGMKPVWDNDKRAWDIALHRLIPNYNIYNYRAFCETIEMCNDGLRRRETPTLTLWGELDQLVPFSTTEHIQKFFPNCQVQIVEGIGHTLFASDKEKEVCRLISDFLKK